MSGEHAALFATNTARSAIQIHDGLHWSAASTARLGSCLSVEQEQSQLLLAGEPRWAL